MQLSITLPGWCFSETTGLLFEADASESTKDKMNAFSCLKGTSAENKKIPQFNNFQSLKLTFHFTILMPTIASNFPVTATFLAEACGSL